MREPRVFLPALALTIAGAMSAATSALADPITYTMVGTQASGSLGGTMFSDATVTLTMIDDTMNVIDDVTDSIFYNPGTATVTVVEGGGLPTLTATFTDTIWVYSTQTPPAGVGFYDTGVNSDIFDNFSSSFEGYDLKTPIGPIISDMTGNSPPLSFPTSDGNFILSGLPATATFTATVAVPEPAIGHGLPVALAVGGMLLGARLLERRRYRAR